ncbi:hypothetical protein O59_003686 [Cellvibrio sp. BR]|nr:hypothetical protein O59_003686 [Cellvibrio sp. BR]
MTSLDILFTCHWGRISVGDGYRSWRKSYSFLAQIIVFLTPRLAASITDKPISE